MQSIIVIRHGERLDCVDYTWAETAARPYDPPLTEKGVEQARDAGKRFVGKVCRESRDSNPTDTLTHTHTHTQEIHCIVSSPFLRCLQTAQLISDILHLPGLHTCNSIVDVFSDHCGIHEQPAVPVSNIADLGINIAHTDTSELPRYPEKATDGVKR